jgi:hypothetical protein
MGEKHDETSALFICDTPWSQPPIIAVFPESFPNETMCFSNGHLFIEALTPQTERQQH